MNFSALSPRYRKASSQQPTKRPAKPQEDFAAFQYGPEHVRDTTTSYSSFSSDSHPPFKAISPYSPATNNVTASSRFTSHSSFCSPSSSSAFSSRPMDDFMKQLQRSTSASSIEIIQDNPRVDTDPGHDNARQRLLRKKLSERSLSSNSTSGAEEQLREKRDRRWAGDGKTTKLGMDVGSASSAEAFRAPGMSLVCPKRRKSTENAMEDVSEELMVELERLRDQEEKLELLEQRRGRRAKHAVTRSKSFEGGGSSSSSSSKNDLKPLSTRRRQKQRKSCTASIRRDLSPVRDEMSPIATPPTSLALDNLILPDYQLALEAIQNRYDAAVRVVKTEDPCAASSFAAPSIPMRRESIDLISLPSDLHADEDVDDDEDEPLPTAAMVFAEG